MKQGAIWLKLQLAWKHYGPAACSVTLIALIGIASAAALLRSARQERASLRETLTAAHATLNTQRQETSTLKPSADTALEQFEGLLKEGADVPAALTENWTAASENHVFTSHAEYRFEPDLPGGFTRMHIVVPVIGTYPAIKHYAFAQLRSNPAMALKKLTVKRERASTGDVSAELHFVLLLKGNVR